MRFVLIDRLVALEPGHSSAARVTFPKDAWFFDDHFPGHPVVPGTVLTEAMAQTGGWLLAATSGFSRLPMLSFVREAKFVRQVVPEEQVDIVAEIRAVRGRDLEVAAVASVVGRRAASARLVFHEIDYPSDGTRESALRGWSEATFRELGGDTLSIGSPHGSES